MHNLSLNKSGIHKVVDNSGPYRVMVVDDSSVIRGLLARWISVDPAIEVIASAANGQIAVKSLERYDPEIIVLDIEMPVMDGLTALPLLLKAKPNVQILMSSTLTSKNAAISLKAMQLGAADYIPKPTTNREMISTQSFQTEIIDKIKSLAEAKRRNLGLSLYKENKTIRKSSDRLVNNSLKPANGYDTRKVSMIKPKIIGVGSSTGGPQALLKFLNGIKDDLSLPVVITQHMPASFTKILASHLSKSSGLDCVEGENGMALRPGKVYVAPGDNHMIISKIDNEYQLKLNKEAPENYCRPSVDTMFRSLSSNYGPAVLGVILTGMGQDGLEGSKKIIDAGGTIIAQDEETSVVWGMPGAVSMAGICNAILPLEKLGDKVKNITRGAG